MCPGRLAPHPLTNLGLLLHLWEEGATPQGLVTLGVFSLNLINLKEEFCFHVCRLVSRLLGTRRFGGAGRLGRTSQGPPPLLSLGGLTGLHGAMS